MRSIVLSVFACCLMACASAAPLSPCAFDHECAAGSCVAFAQGAFDRETGARSLCTAACVSDDECAGLSERARCTGRGVCLALCADGCEADERCAGSVCVPDGSAPSGGRSIDSPAAALPIGFIEDGARYAIAVGTGGSLWLPGDAIDVRSDDLAIVSASLGQAPSVVHYDALAPGDVALSVTLVDGSVLRVVISTARAATLTVCEGCLGALDVPVDERDVQVADVVWLEPVLRGQDGSFLWAGDARFALARGSDAFVMMALPSLQPVEGEVHAPGVALQRRTAAGATLEVSAAGLTRSIRVGG